MDCSLTTNNSIKICSIHRNPMNFVDIFDVTDKSFICISCAREKEIKLEGLLLLNELQDDNHFSILVNFPPLEESVPPKMKEFLKLQNKHQGILKAIEDYFSHLLIEIQSYISQAKNQAKGKVSRMLKSNEEMFLKYNEISRRSELRQILNEGGEQMESKIFEIFKKFLLKEELKNNSKILGECLDLNKIWRESVNFSIPNKIKDSILNMILNIDFFSGFSETSVEQNQLIKNQEMENNRKNTSNCDHLMDLISSPFNFCQEEFLIKTKKMFDELSICLNSYNLGENFYQVDSRNSLQKLNKRQLQSIVDLSKKMTEISEAYEMKNIQQQDIDQTIQSKTYFILQILNKTGLSQCVQNELKLQLKYFPIIELIPTNPFQSLILKSVNLIKSKYAESQKLITFKEINGHLVAMQDCQNGNYMISYCNFLLDKNKQYIFRLSLSQAKNNDSNSLMFGLLPDSERDSVYLCNKNMIYCEKDLYNKMTKIVRGGKVNQGDGYPVNKQFEMRISLEKKILRVSDYPNYSNVCEIDDINKIQPDVAYRFGISSQKESALMKITDIIEVNIFDEKM